MEIAILRKFQVCGLTKCWRILHSNADIETMHAFSHSWVVSSCWAGGAIGQLLPLAGGSSQP